MDTENSVSRWVAGAKVGDEQAVQELWKRYYTKLVRLCRRRLGEHPRRAVDEEDLAANAFASFCAGVEKGKFPRLNDRDDLWGLLFTISVRKVADQIQYDRRQKRGGGRVRGESVFGGSSKDDTGRGIEQVVGEEPSPELALAMTEEYERLLDILNKQESGLRQIVELKLDALTNKEIAKRTGAPLRTVERKLGLIRETVTKRRLT